MCTHNPGNWVIFEELWRIRGEAKKQKCWLSTEGKKVQISTQIAQFNVNSQENARLSFKELMHVSLRIPTPSTQHTRGLTLSLHFPNISWILFAWVLRAFYAHIKIWVHHTSTHMSLFSHFNLLTFISQRLSEHYMAGKMLHAINAKKNALHNVAWNNFRVRHSAHQPRGFHWTNYMHIDKHLILTLPQFPHL